MLKTEYRLTNQQFHERDNESYGYSNGINYVSNQNNAIYSTDLLSTQANDILDYTTFNEIKKWFDENVPTPDEEIYAFTDFSNLQTTAVDKLFETTPENLIKKSNNNKMEILAESVASKIRMPSTSEKPNAIEIDENTGLLYVKPQEAGFYARTGTREFNLAENTAPINPKKKQDSVKANIDLLKVRKWPNALSHDAGNLLKIDANGKIIYNNPNMPIKLKTGSDGKITANFDLEWNTWEIWNRRTNQRIALGTFENQSTHIDNTDPIDIIFRTNNKNYLNIINDAARGGDYGQDVYIYPLDSDFTDTSTNRAKITYSTIIFEDGMQVFINDYMFNTISDSSGHPFPIIEIECRDTPIFSPNIYMPINPIQATKVNQATGSCITINPHIQTINSITSIRTSFWMNDNKYVIMPVIQQPQSYKPSLKTYNDLKRLEKISKILEKKHTHKRGL